MPMKPSKKYLKAVLLAWLLAVVAGILSAGCIVVPGDGDRGWHHDDWHHGDWHHDHD